MSLSSSATAIIDSAVGAAAAGTSNKTPDALSSILKMPENEQYLFLLDSISRPEQRLRIGLVLDYYIKNANFNSQVGLVVVFHVVERLAYWRVTVVMN